MKLQHLLKQVLTFTAAAVVGLFMTAGSASASTDLTITCTGPGSCSVSPAATPLVNEAGWFPGSEVTQRFTMNNNTPNNSFVGIEVYDYSELRDLGEVIMIEIRQNSAVGPLVYDSVTLHEFRDDGYFTIDSLNAGSSRGYYLTARMLESAGNQYQGGEAVFSLRFGLELLPIPPTSGGGDGSGTPGSVLGATSPASAPVCTDNPPSSAPIVTITNVGINTVSLSWTSVAPLTHYGIAFTRTSDGAQYGSTNIGNVNSYTVTNLSGGSNYTFQVFGVNNCAPGPFSGNTATGIVAGPIIDTRPVGPAGEVLGDQDEQEVVEQPAAEIKPGLVAGAIDDICRDWKKFIPWIILVAQAIVVILVEYLFRRDHSISKYILITLTTIVSIVLFYWLRDCDCYGQIFWLLGLLCRWYWVVAIFVTLIERLISYAFIEEVKESE